MQEPVTYKNDFWDHISHQSAGLVFGHKEETFLKKVPGGWLVRALFIKGRRHTRSGIIFCPDPETVWREGTIAIKWEHIKTESNPNRKHHLHRLKTPIGWIVKEFLTTRQVSTGEGSTGLSLTYIPDPGHEWTIEQAEQKQQAGSQLAQGESGLKICIHRGSNQIGGSCVEIEHEGQRIILDMGLPLDSESNDKTLLPAIKGLDGSDPSLLGIFISHMHLDHTGLLKHISPEVKVGMGAATRRIMDATQPFLPDKFPSAPAGWDFQPWQPFQVGPFTITPHLVDHSAYDAYAFLVEAGGKRVFYTGDFRAHGRKASIFQRMLNKPLKNIDALLMEGSSLGRLASDQRFPTEQEIEEHFVRAFAETKGLAMVHASGQNIDRVVSIMRASKRSGRILLIDLYVAVILAATENVNIPQSHWPEMALLVPHSQRVKILKNKWFDSLKKHSSNRVFIEKVSQNPEKYTLLFRPLYIHDLDRANCLQDAAYIYSQWEGYWERGDYEKVKKWLGDNRIGKQSIHTSGHASPADLQDFVKAMAPAKVVPIHSFQPDQYAALFPNVEAHQDGEWWAV